MEFLTALTICLILGGIITNLTGVIIDPTIDHGRHGSSSAEILIEEIEFDENGYLVDFSKWTRKLAVKMAREGGF